MSDREFAEGMAFSVFENDEFVMEIKHKQRADNDSI
jgi:hypothetical protein